MGRKTEQEWDGLTVETVMATTTLNEAKQAEDLLTEAGFDYMVELEPAARGGLLSFGRVNAAVFYLLEEDAPKARQHLAESGLGRRVIHPPTE